MSTPCSYKVTAACRLGNAGPRTSVVRGRPAVYGRIKSRPFIRRPGGLERLREGLDKFIWSYSVAARAERGRSIPSRPELLPRLRARFGDVADAWEPYVRGTKKRRRRRGRFCRQLKTLHCASPSPRWTDTLRAGLQNGHGLPAKASPLLRGSHGGRASGQKAVVRPSVSTHTSKPSVSRHTSRASVPRHTSVPRSADLLVAQRCSIAARQLCAPA